MMRIVRPRDPPGGWPHNPIPRAEIVAPRSFPHKRQYKLVGDLSAEGTCILIRLCVSVVSILGTCGLR